MATPDRFTCTLRIDIDDADPALLDVELGVQGDHMHIVRKASGHRKALDFHRWEYPVEPASGHTDWTALEEALATHAGALRGAQRTLSRYGALGQAYWWCGCFHDDPPSMVYLRAELVKALAGIGVHLHIDNYFPSSESAFAPSTPQPEEADDLPAAAGHAYRFWFDEPGKKINAYLVDGPSAEGLETWHQFGEGLEHALTRINVAPLAESGNVVVCEHIQFAFDGGPVIEPIALKRLAEEGMGIAILWKLA